MDGPRGDRRNQACVGDVALEEMSHIGGFFLGLRDCSDKFAKDMSFLRAAKDGTAGLVRTAIKQTPWWSKMDSDARASSLAEQTLAPAVAEVVKDLENDVNAARQECLTKLPIWLDSLREMKVASILDTLASFEHRKLDKLEGTLAGTGVGEASEDTMAQLSESVSFFEQLCPLLPKQHGSTFIKFKDRYAALKSSAKEAKDAELAQNATTAFLSQDTVSARSKKHNCRACAH